MIDIATPKGRVVAAALRLAAERPWQEITLRQIAEAAGLSLADLSDEFSSKAGVLRAFVKCVDREVLEKAPGPVAGESPRDALFEVIMARFDLLEPYKAALRSIVASGEMDLAMIGPMLSSQAWMLQAAGIDSGGPAGGVRTAGLASVYARVFRAWLDDDDPGLARTMAVLDRRLRGGESVMAGLDGAISSVRKLGQMLRSGFGSRTRADKDSGRQDAEGDLRDEGTGPAEPAGSQGAV
ncbi:MAG: TetR family transcriptional regulator [Alphaproteobacteria bacterium]|nr:TetR family transcriptional regulator [Alphaproteobacteria bacterium]